MKNKEHYELVGKTTCKKVLSENPTYKIFWQFGFSFKGAKESIDDKQPKEEYIWQERQSRVLTFEERMERRYEHSSAIDVFVDHDKKEIHFNGFSCNDLYQEYILITKQMRL